MTTQLIWLGQPDGGHELPELDAAWPREDHDEPDFAEAARKVRSGWYAKPESKASREHAAEPSDPLPQRTSKTGRPKGQR